MSDPSHPLYPFDAGRNPLTGGPCGDRDGSSRQERARGFTLAECRAALANKSLSPPLQQTVRRQLEARLRRLEREAAG